MKRIAIIGGGIAGLSAAFYLEKARRAGARPAMGACLKNQTGWAALYKLSATMAL